MFYDNFQQYKKRQEQSIKSSQPFLFYLGNVKPYFLTTNQNELCTNYGIHLEVDDQIDCRQAFPVADGILGAVTYRHLTRSEIRVNDNDDPDATLPAGCHVMAQGAGAGNHLEFNPTLVGSSHPNAWQVCRSCKYQNNRKSW